ncbi:DUF3016 domain-containing protein [Psychrosphaera sp. B3R10]|uniref:DUF3016 domain-containing protein n=1 Tax=unclassified Psychrosphaera TaxID=2641570 RepID=UPI001C0852C2|nr:MULTISPECIES: DUF3016 domain-containing protein [unclassified Psychrosphaera]MBU2882625.1 DUF3016 domain-containing protein [Psychrosphaera sp. I2R16]MBU2989356.1 DUF3016 domain-containing protein [Psychrosphaera sp. B3R10]
MKLGLLIIFFLTLPTAAYFDENAKNVNVTWHQPAKYTDVRGTNESKARFQKRVFNQLEKHIVKLAASLPKDIQLDMTITDVNLAGDVQFNFSMNREIRIVKSIYWPKIAFDFKITQSDKLLDQGSVVIKDMSFMHRGGLLRSSADSFKYDKRLLTNWFNNELQQKVTNFGKINSAVMSE